MNYGEHLSQLQKLSKLTDEELLARFDDVRVKALKTSPSFRSCHYYDVASCCHIVLKNRGLV